MVPVAPEPAFQTDLPSFFPLRSVGDCFLRRDVDDFAVVIETAGLDWFVDRELVVLAEVDDNAEAVSLLRYSWCWLGNGIKRLNRINAMSFVGGGVIHDGV